jgi:uncharacterized protein YggU (UPF0235/DUF167 family)
MDKTIDQSAGVRIRLKVVPGASQTAIVGWLDDRLKLRVSAAPERGRANAAVEALIADSLGLERAAVRVVAGHGSPRKTQRIDGMTETAIMRGLGRNGHG